MTGKNSLAHLSAIEQIEHARDHAEWLATFEPVNDEPGNPFDLCNTLDRDDYEDKDWLRNERMRELELDGQDYGEYFDF